MINLKLNAKAKNMYNIIKKINSKEKKKHNLHKNKKKKINAKAIEVSELYLGLLLTCLASLLEGSLDALMYLGWLKSSFEFFH